MTYVGAGYPASGQVIFLRAFLLYHMDTDSEKLFMGCLRTRILPNVQILQVLLRNFL